MHVLVVEDDPAISQPLVAGLRREGYLVTHAETGGKALAAMMEIQPDPTAAPLVNQDIGMVLLDLGLPDIDGRVVCQRIREASAVPIIVVTARGDEIDRVLLLELGADDYVVKPFGFRELVARIRAVERRIALVAAASGVTNTAEQAADDQQSKEALLAGLAISIDRRTRQVHFEGAPVQLTPKEYDLLDTLATDPGALFTREQLIDRVWDENWWGSTKTLDVHVASLRKKLRSDVIATVRGVGYRLAVSADANNSAPNNGGPSR